MSIKSGCVVVAIVVVLSSGCTSRMGGSGNDPQKRLSEYIATSFAVKNAGDRQMLMSYLAGDAKTRLATWSDDQFREAFIDSKRQFLKLVVPEVKITTPDKAATITYEITYLDKSKGHEAKITNKKVAQMVYDQGRWYISDVQSEKELVEYRNEMSLP